MDNKKKRFLLVLFLLSGIAYFIFHGLALAKGVLAPFFLAIILAMTLTPVANFLERKGFKRAWSSFFSDLIFLVLILSIMGAVGLELQGVVKQWPDIQNRLTSRMNELEAFIEEKSGFTMGGPGFTNPEQEIAQGQEAEIGIPIEDLPVRSWLQTSLEKVLNFSGTILLILVYIFFMLLYRRKFENAVLKYLPDKDKNRGKQVLSEIIKNAQHYFFARMIVILIDASLYAIGFSISGIKSPITTAILAAVLAIVPYVGNIVGGSIAVVLAFITTASLQSVWIVLGTMVITQFVESYFISPYLVGKRVHINPLFTIFTIVVGGAVWGIIGMIVFLPLFSFLKAVADHVPILNPLGYTLGNEDVSEVEET
ncbi:AI-2E family transporter [Nafulsella turpanensis]|uniref:AI-2E family transporter n=1 Tax=Nafulsella turpanensis TaxID=1265690 RepID=UPI000345C659|nr:AI-2E family transporter [Nafulsella turpanensis]